MPADRPRAFWRPPDRRAPLRPWGAGPRLPGVTLLCLTDAEVTPGPAWLGPREAARLAAMRFAPRRASFLLGRAVAKRLLCGLLGEPDPTRLELVPDADGAPHVVHDGRPVALSFSLGHRAGLAVAAAGPRHLALGCDVELIEPRSAAFLEDYLAPSERTALARFEDAALLANLCWSAKESALKALGVGLARDPRELETRAGQDGGLTVVDRLTGQVEGGLWWRHGPYVLTCLAARRARGG